MRNRFRAMPPERTRASRVATDHMKVLIIEDDRKIASFIANGFKEAGMVVDIRHDGMEGLDAALIYDYDAMVVDLLLPSLDGLSIIEQMRAKGVRTPVLILSTKRSVNDRILGIRKGGDDYMVKPFSFSELLVRVQALVRRSSIGTSPATGEPVDTEALQVADLELDPWKREARRGDTSISLHAREFALLEYLMRNRDRVVSKTAILENVYGYDFDPQTNVVDVLVCRLRNKIDKRFDPKLIHTVRGVGYVLKSG